MVVTGSGYQKFSLRLNLDFEIAKWISFGINSSYAMTKQDREDGNFNDFITSSPLAEIYDADGKYTNISTRKEIIILCTVPNIMDVK